MNETQCLWVTEFEGVGKFEGIKYQKRCTLINGSYKNYHINKFDFTF